MEESDFFRNSHRSFGIPPIFEASPNEENNGLPPLELNDKMELEESKSPEVNLETEEDLDRTRSRSISMPMHKLFFKGAEGDSPAFTPLRISSKNEK